MITTITTTPETTSETELETTSEMEDTFDTISSKEYGLCWPNPCENNGYCLFNGLSKKTMCLCSLKYTG